MTSSYSFRPPRVDEGPAIAALRRAVVLADYGADEDDAENIELVLRMLDLRRDAWVVEDRSGALVAEGFVRVRHPTRLRSLGNVLPEHRGRGIGAGLLRRIEARG